MTFKKNRTDSLHPRPSSIRSVLPVRGSSTRQSESVIVILGSSHCRLVGCLLLIGAALPPLRRERKAKVTGGRLLLSSSVEYLHCASSLVLPRDPPRRLVDSPFSLSERLQTRHRNRSSSTTPANRYSGWPGSLQRGALSLARSNFFF